MRELESLTSEASRLVTPSASQEKRLKSVAEGMMARVEEASRQYPEVRGSLLGGSFAKGTWLPGDADLDIFVRISEETGEDRFEEVGLGVGRMAVAGYPYGKKYAQHPYTEAIVEKVKVNIVPCYDVQPGRWKSAADRSQYHVRFVKENLGSEDRTQVRLLKRFMKTVGVYGAEIEQEGFSGYAAEVLVYDHGGFEGVLRHFAGFKPAEGALFSLKDPVDKERELGTAVSKESVARMALASRAFLSDPSLRYFRGVRRRVRRALVRRAYALRFEHKPLSEDTLWGELKRSTRQVVRHVESRGFSVARAAAASDGSARSAIILLPEVEELPELEERVGPGVELAREVERFLSKNSRDAELIWAGEDGRVHLMQRREHTNIRALLKELCGPGIASVGASRDLAAGIRKSGVVLSGRGIEERMRKERWFMEGVEEIVSDTIGTNPAS